MLNRTVHVLSAERYAQAESPRWDARTGELVWIDMATGALHSAQIGSNGLRIARSMKIGDQIGAAAPLAAEGAGWILGTGSQVVHVSDSDRITPLVSARALGSLNDGACDPSGRFWIGTQTTPRKPEGALLTLETDGHLVERLGGVTVSNGVVFTEDGATMFYIDTLPRRSIEAFDVAPDGALSRRRHICAVVGGNPDGMAMDDEGTLWVAVWGAGQVHRYSTDGTLLEVIALPVVQPTAVTFMDSMLIVTSASVGLREPSAIDGAILGVDVGVGGRPALPWGGRIADNTSA